MAGSTEDSPERLARNVSDLLQELRVALAGVQILFGFLFSIVSPIPIAGPATCSAPRTWWLCCSR